MKTHSTVCRRYAPAVPKLWPQSAAFHKSRRNRPSSRQSGLRSVDCRSRSPQRDKTRPARPPGLTPSTAGIKRMSQLGVTYHGTVFSPTRILAVCCHNQISPMLLSECYTQVRTIRSFFLYDPAPIHPFTGTHKGRCVAQSSLSTLEYVD